jgi:DHA1 family tetracycline resistance protein-like MFS transporter
MGALSDIYGRRPFILFSQCLWILPILVLYLHVTCHITYLWYYLIQVATSALSATTISLAYLADLMQPQHRAASFGIIMAVFSLAIIIGPLIGGMLTVQAALKTAMAGCLVALVYSYIFLPESLSEEARMEAKEKQYRRNNNGISSSSGGGGGSSNNNNSGIQQQGSMISIIKWTSSSLVEMWRAPLAILTRSPLYKRLTITLMITAVVSEGLMDVLTQYVQIKLNFLPIDQSHLFITFGVCALIVQSLLLKPALAAIGEKRVLVVGLAAHIGQQVWLAAASGKWMALTAVSLGSVGSIIFPTISSIKSNNADESEQGTVQGALSGARALAAGVGPLAFAALFSIFTKQEPQQKAGWWWWWGVVPYFPGAPFVFGAALMTMAMVLAIGLPADAGGTVGYLFSSSNSNRKAEDEERAPLRLASSLSTSLPVSVQIDEDGARLLLEREEHMLLQ